MKLGLFSLLTICGFLVFALTMTFVPVMPMWLNYVVRAALLAGCGVMWRALPVEGPASRFRPVLFAYFAAVFGLSLSFCLGSWALRLFGLSTNTPAGVAVAKFSEALLIVVGVLVVARLAGQDLASLYIRKGGLALGLGIGLIGAAVCLALTLQQPAVKALGMARLISLAPWVLLFVLSNGFMEELLFRGLFLGRYEPLVGKWMAIVSTSLAFTLAHMQVTYAPDLLGFLVILLGLSISWAWLMHKTRSLWGAALFHAGADLLIILPIFSGLGAV